MCKDNTPRPTSIPGMTAERCIHNENFVDVNNLTRQYFALMMNLLESPFLMSFLSHHYYSAYPKELRSFQEKVLKDNNVSQLAPKNRWQVQTTPFTNALLSDGAIIYKAKWNDLLTNNMSEHQIHVAAQRALGKYAENMILHLLPQIGLERQTDFSKNAIKEQLQQVNNRIADELFQDLVVEILEKLISEDKDYRKDRLATIAERTAEHFYENKSGKSRLWELIKVSINRLKDQEVYLTPDGLLAGLDRYISSVSNDHNVKNLSGIIELLKDRNELYFVLPNMPRGTRRNLEFDVVVYIGSLMYHLSRDLQEMVQGNCLPADCKFDFIAYQKMNGCNWTIPSSTAIKLDPNLLWPKLEIEYEEGGQNRMLRVENIANGIEWKEFEVTNKVDLVRLPGQEVEIHSRELIPYSREIGNLTNLMTETVHEHGQTKAIVRLEEFLRSDDRKIIRKTVIFPYIC